MTRTTTFSATRADICNAAARKIDAIGEGETLSAEEKANFVFALNMLIKEMGTDGCPLWKQHELVIPLISGTKEYQIGPTATGTGALVGDRPIKIIDTCYVRDSAGLDTGLQVLSKQEYNQLGLKSTSSTVSQIYYDPQLANGILRVYGTPSDSTHTAYLTAQTPVYDMNSDSETLDFPQEGFKAVVYGLAEDMMDEYPGLGPQKEARIVQKANYYKNKLADWSQEEVSIFFQPNPSLRNR